MTCQQLKIRASRQLVRKFFRHSTLRGTDNQSPIFLRVKDVAILVNCGCHSIRADTFGGLAQIIEQADFPVFRVRENLLREAMLRGGNIS